MQALKNNNMHDTTLNIIKYCMPTLHRWLAFETNVLL